MALSSKLRALRANLKFDNWPVAVLHRALFRREPLVVYRMHGVTFLVDFEGGDQCGTRECMVYDMYSRYFPHLPKNRPLTVLDLGANGGGFPLSLLAHSFAISKGVSVEMNPNTYTRLQFNLNYNARSHCRCINAALAAKSGWIDLNNTKGSTGESMYSPLQGREEERVRVPLMTFDEIMSTHFGDGSSNVVDVCKVDVEGAEEEVLLSDTCRSLERVGFLVIEIHQTVDIAELKKRIVSHGFEEVDADKANGEVHFFRNVRLDAKGNLD